MCSHSFTLFARGGTDKTSKTITVNVLQSPQISGEEAIYLKVGLRDNNANVVMDGNGNHGSPQPVDPVVPADKLSSKSSLRSAKPKADIQNEKNQTEELA